MTGNGSFDAGAQNFGDSFVKLKLAGNQLMVQDYFTPCNEKLLDRTCTGNGEACDLDLGSAEERRRVWQGLLYICRRHADDGQASRSDAIRDDLPEPECLTDRRGWKLRRTGWSQGPGRDREHPRLARVLEGASHRAHLRLGRERSIACVHMEERQAEDSCGDAPLR